MFIKEKIIETVIGFSVICIAIIFFTLFFKVAALKKCGDFYYLNAKFQDVEGLQEGSDVKISGINIGYVDRLGLENETNFALVKLKIKKGIFIPSDSRAIIATSGLFGNKYVKISPGSESSGLEDNQVFKFTQSSFNIENLINNLVYFLTTK